MSSNGNIFRVIGPLSPKDSPHKDQWRRALCFLWSALEQKVEQTIETPVIWDAIVIIMTSLQWLCQCYNWPSAIGATHRYGRIGLENPNTRKQSKIKSFANIMGCTAGHFILTKAMTRTPYSLFCVNGDCHNSYCMMTPWHEGTFCVTGYCEGNPTMAGGFPSQGPVMRVWCFLWYHPFNK